MRKYDYIDRVLYMAILAQEATETDAQTLTWKIAVHGLKRKGQLLPPLIKKPLEKSSGANK